MQEVIDVLTQSISSQMFGPLIPSSGLKGLLDELDSIRAPMGKQEFDEAFEAFMGDLLLAEVTPETTEWISKFQKRIYERMKWK